MLDLSKDVSKVHHKGQPLDIGIVKYKHKRSNKMIIEISKQNASYHGKKWSEMTDVEQDNLEDLLYLTNIQEADVRFLYV